MQPDFWNVFHDGSVTCIAGPVTGTVVITIEIRYLRGVFPGDGDSFLVTLSECTSIVYQEWDGEIIRDPGLIAQREPEILQAKPVPRGVTIGCAKGLLRMQYADAKVALDSGEPVTYEQMVAASKRYWDALRAQPPST